MTGGFITKSGPGTGKKHRQNSRKIERLNSVLCVCLQCFLHSMLNHVVSAQPRPRGAYAIGSHFFLATGDRAGVLLVRLFGVTNPFSVPVFPGFWRRSLHRMVTNMGKVRLSSSHRLGMEVLVVNELPSKPPAELVVLRKAPGAGADEDENPQNEPSVDLRQRKEESEHTDRPPGFLQVSSKLGSA